MAGRRPGSLVRCTCVACGAVERASGTGGHYRCAACKYTHRYGPHSRRSNWTGTEEAGGFVHRAIADGRLPHPRGLTCADCGGVAVEYDHRDYNEPLRVEPVCRGCNLRRGPATPLVGSIRRLVENGMRPYYSRGATLKVLQRLGISTQGVILPSKVQVDDWRALLPLVEAAESSRAPSTERTVV